MMADRRHVTATLLAAQTGLTRRWFTGQAAQGKIPGAYQPAGAKGAWRFDEGMFWRWWESRRPQEERIPAWRRRSTAARPGGGVSSVRAGTSDDPLRRRITAQLSAFARAGLPK